MKKYCLAILIIIVNHLNLSAQISQVRQITKTPRQYEKSEWDITLTQSWENPYLQEDVALDMVITTPSGKKLSLPCFYVKGVSGTLSDWKARFTPQENGNYKYSFILTKDGKSVSTKPGAFVAQRGLKNGFLHPKDNWTLTFDNGKPFRGLGENLAWESRANDDSKFFKALHENPKYNYEYMLPSLAAHGGNFFRTWVCTWNLPIDWKRGFNSKRYTNSTEFYNPSAIAKLDRMLVLSDSLNLYVMLTLGMGASNVRDGGFATSNADFFVNPKSKILYKNRLRFFIARWGYSPNIAAWELFNEIDNVQFGNAANPINAQSIVQWHDEMSAYIKQIDPYKHLVTTSISHRDLQGLNSLANIDLNQKHIYKNNIGIPSTIVKYENDFNKPYTIGEYGYEWDWSKDFNLFGKEMDSDFKRGLWYGLFSPTPILPLSWWWEFFDSRGTDAYFSRVRKIQDDMMASGKGKFETISASGNPDLHIYGVKCGSKAYVYAFNPSKDDLTTVFEISSGLTGSKYQITAYDCETGKSTNIKSLAAISNKVQINDFKLQAGSDVVFIIAPVGK